MSSKPLVFCIIIFLNAEKFFEQIESLFAQTYDRIWICLCLLHNRRSGRAQE